jgi:hypothetical protein
MAAKRTQEEEVLLKLTQQVSGPAADARVSAAQLTEEIIGSVAALRAMNDASRVLNLKNLEAEIVTASGSLKEMQAQMRAMQKAPSVDIEQYRKLKGSIDQQQQSLAKMKGEYSAMAGFAKKAGNDVASGAAKGTAGLATVAKAARLVGGSSGSAAARVIALGTDLVAMGLGAIVAGAALAGLAVGIIAIVGFFFAGMKAADGFRDELLKLQGAMLGNAQAGKEAQSAINAVASSAFNALPRDKLAEYATQLGRMRLRGKDLETALEAAAIAGSAAGDAMATNIIGAAGAAKMAGQSMDQLAARTKRIWGGVAASQAYSLTAQIRRMREDLTSLFSGATLDPFLSGLKNITSMFGQNTELGQSLKRAVSSVFDRLSAIATAALPYVKGAMLGFAIGMVKAYLAARDIYDAIEEWAGPLLKATGFFDNTTVAIEAGKVAAYGLLAAFAVAGVLIAYYMAPVIAVIAGVGAAVYALSKIIDLNVWLWGGIGRAIVDSFTKARDFLTGISLADIGRNMVKSFTNAIVGSVGEVGESLWKLGEAAKAGLKSALGIHSPSTFAIAAADNVTGTFTDRVDDAAPEVRTSLDEFISPQSVKSTAKAARASGGARIAYFEMSAGASANDQALFDKIRSWLREEWDTELTLVESP